MQTRSQIFDPFLSAADNRMACLDPYQPPAIQGDLNLLVVDGFVNGSNQSASVRLTAALPLDTTALPQGIDMAQVSIEQKDGGALYLQDVGNGKYETYSIPWNMDAQYRLNITLNSGENYLSDTSVEEK